MLIDVSEERIISVFRIGSSTFLPQVNVYQITWRDIPCHGNLHGQFRDNLKSLELRLMIKP
jgi:hypothetical protein